MCRHPHVVQIENIFDEGDLPCMVMEYIEGEDLGRFIIQKTGALSQNLKHCCISAKLVMH